LRDDRPAAIASFTNNGPGADRHIEATVSASTVETAAASATAGRSWLGRLFTASMDEAIELLADDICSLLRKGALGI